MNLTAKAKQDFEAWFLSRDWNLTLAAFDAKEPPLRFAILKEWFESAGIEVGAESGYQMKGKKRIKKVYAASVEEKTRKWPPIYRMCPSLEEARTEAIRIADSEYNAHYFKPDFNAPFGITWDLGEA